MQFILQNYNFLSQILAYKKFIMAGSLHPFQRSAATHALYFYHALSHITYILARCSVKGRSQRPCGLRCWSAAGRLPELRVRIPPWALMSVSCECCVLSGRGLCDGPIPRPEESHRLWFAWVWYRKFKNEAAMTQWGPLSHKIFCKHVTLTHMWRSFKFWCKILTPSCVWVRALLVAYCA